MLNAKTTTPEHHVSMKKVLDQLPAAFTAADMTSMVMFLNAYYRLFENAQTRATILDLIDILTDSIGSGKSAPAKGADPMAARSTVCYIVGHTALAGGAYSNSLLAYEYHYWKEVATIIKRNATMRRAFNVHVFTRDKSTERAYKDALAESPDLIVELHFNAGGGPAATGIETLCIGDMTSKNGKAAAAFSRYIQQGTGLALRQSGSGVKRVYDGDRGFANLALAGDRPAILIEPFFGTNTSDCAHWSDYAGAALRIENATFAALTAVKG